MRLNVSSLALTLAVIFSVFTLSVTLVHAATGYADRIVELLSSLYAGVVRFNHNSGLGFWENIGGNILSVLLCTVFSFIDGVILGASTGFLYNFLLPKENK